MGVVWWFGGCCVGVWWVLCDGLMGVVWWFGGYCVVV